MRGEQYSRQWRILNLLQSPAGRRLDELAEEFGVNERTVRRAVEALEAAGFPIYDEATDDRGKVWKLDKDWIKLPPISFSADEVLALYFAEKMLGGIQGAGFDEAIGSLLGKVNAVLPDDNRQLLAAIANRMITSQKVSSLDPGIKEYIDVISAAIAKHLLVVGKYHSGSGSKTKERKIAPYAIWTVNQNLYLIGWCYKREDFLTFRLDRFNALSLTQESYDPDPEFDLDKYVDDSFGGFHLEPEEVVIEFDADLKEYFSSHIVHPTQEIIVVGGDAIQVKFMVGASAPFISWILGFGCKARVIKPTSLKDDVCQELIQALSPYQKT